MKKEVYGADSIQVLEGLEAVRVRPGMYIGGVSGSNPPGLYRICKEIIDNSLDEYLAGRNDALIILYDTKSSIVSIIDHGHGIPTGKKKNGDYALTDAVTKLHAGGKFEQGAYKVSSGLHGVGLKTANALSTYFQVWSNSGSGWYTQYFKKGKPTSKVIKEKPKHFSKYVSNTGVVISYKPDDTIFVDTIKLNITRLKKELIDIQYLCPGLKICLYVDGTKHTYSSREGLAELVSRDTNIAKPFVFSSTNLDVALCWTKEEGTLLNSYVNISNTAEGGTHLDGLRRSVLKCLREYTDDKVEVDDLLEGLVGAIHYKMSNPVYTGQTKDKLTNVEVIKDVSTQLEPKLKHYFSKNKSLTDSIIKYAEKMLRERGKLKDSKDLLRGVDKLTKSIKTIPDKFLDADRRKFKNPNDLELFIVEGDSAGGLFGKAREGFQAALKIRGKMINSAKTTANNVIGNAKGGGNKECRDLITVLGCGILSKYDESKLRFGKIIILADADIDGQHIQNLVLTFITTYIPELIKNGHVYIIDAPLFIGTSSSHRAFGKTRAEIDSKMKKRGISKYDIIRLKGWGEVNHLQLSELCLSPDTRKLVQLKWSDDAESSVNKIMGNDVSFRKELLGLA